MANDAPKTTQLQLQHIRQAAYALATTAPEISAHLMSRYLSLSPPDFNLYAERSTACFACGTIRTPGCVPPAQTAAVHESEKKRKRHKSGKNDGKSDSSSISYVCAACKNITVSADPPNTGTSFSPKRSSTATDARTLTLTVAPAATKSPCLSTKPSSSQSSRKRSKKGTLSKMLAAQKPGTSGSGPSGLNLMDLLKTT
jgi:hypothetical protein